jgi:hypothetical protein
MAVVTNEALGLVLPAFDAAYRAAVATAAEHHLPPDLARVAASYTIDEARVARQQQYLATRVDGAHPFWKQVVGKTIDPLSAAVNRTTHLCVRTNGEAITIYYVGEDMDPTAVRVGYRQVVMLMLTARAHNVRRAMTPLRNTALFADVIMTTVPTNWKDAWDNVWVGEGEPTEPV